jgi:hypothetical protein
VYKPNGLPEFKNDAHLLRTTGRSSGKPRAAGRPRSTTNKKFSTRAEAILCPRSISTNPVVVVSHVQHSAIVEVVAPSSRLAWSTQDESIAEAVAHEGEPADADKPAEGGEGAEGVVTGGAAEQTTDKVASALAVDGPT